MKEDKKDDSNKKYNLFYEGLDYVELYKHYKDKSGKYKTNKYKQEVINIDTFYKRKIDDEMLEYMSNRKSILEDFLDNSKNKINNTLNNALNIFISIITTVSGYFLGLNSTNINKELPPLIMIVIMLCIYTGSIYFFTRLFFNKIVIKPFLKSKEEYKDESFLRNLIEYELSVINNKMNDYIKNLKEANKKDKTFLSKIFKTKR